MVTLSYSTIREFAKKHQESSDALHTWFNVVEKADWSNFHDVKEDFNSVDAVGNDRYVFNIKGNKYRLVALISFNVRTVYVLFVGTHSEYDRIDASQILFKRK